MRRFHAHSQSAFTMPFDAPDPDAQAESRAESWADTLALLLDGMDHAAALLDGRGAVLVANAAFSALTGQALGQSRSRAFADLLEDEGRQAWNLALADASSGASAVLAVSMRRASLADEPVALLPVELSIRQAAPGRSDALVLNVREALRHREDEDRMLQWIARATAPLTGQDFFRILMRNLAEAFGFRRAFIAECMNQPTTRVRTLAFWSDQTFRPDFEFDLAGTPCEMTIRDGQVFCINEGMQQRYAWAERQHLDSYLGAPIFDSRGEQLIGHVAFETSGRIDRAVLNNPLFQIFVSRAAAELRRKRAEDVLRTSEENYRLLVEHQTDVIVQYDAQQRISFASPSFARLFDRSEASLLGSSYRPPVADEDRPRFAEAWDALKTAPHESRFEERVLTVNGWRCLAWSQKAMLDGSGAVSAVVAVGRDVTDRLRAEEQGRQHLQQLAHVSRLSAMGEMASAIAHEINQPLTAMRTYAQASQRLLAAGAAPAELSDTLGRIASQAERASEIIRRLRGFLARDEVRTLPVEPNYIVSEVMALVRADASQCGVQLMADLAENLPRVNVDCIQIEQVLLNLVRNGMEAMQQCAADGGGAGGEACEDGQVLRISTRLVDHEVVISVKDSGPGVPEDLAPTIFDAFVTHKPGGMGIGLAISRSIAEAHSARLWLADNHGGGGALFHLALPAMNA